MCLQEMIVELHKKRYNQNWLIAANLCVWTIDLGYGKCVFAACMLNDVRPQIKKAIFMKP